MAGLRVSRLPIGGCVHSGRLGVIVAVSETPVTCPSLLFTSIEAMDLSGDPSGYYYRDCEG
jgi:hypothetical protein